MTRESHYPEWPTPEWESREAALIAAIADSDNGDEVVVHQAGCSRRRGEDCDCAPEVIVVREGRA